MDRSAAPPGVPLDADFKDRLTLLFEAGWAHWEKFDIEVRHREWHPFVHGDYERLLSALLELRAPGRRFLEWGSATGVITIMADFLGFESYGIELDRELVDVARALAEEHGSNARFATGSFLPSGYDWRRRTRDGRLGTIGEGRSAYPDLGIPLDEFDLVYAYPWHGEGELMLDLMRTYGDPQATLLLFGGEPEVQMFRGGRPVSGALASGGPFRYRPR